MAETNQGSESAEPNRRYRLPPPAYYDADWFQREQHSLFPAVWNLVGTEADLADAGDFVTASIGNYPVAVVRGQDGVLRGFHNICRHRGARLLDGAGQVNRILCSYHRWQYALDGSLENVPQHATQIPLLDLDKWALKPVRVESWMGLVFVNPDGTAKPLNTWLGDLRPHLDPYRLNDLTRVATADMTLPANWKFYVENHLDFYHLWYTHARTLADYDHHRGHWRTLGPHWVSFDPRKPDRDPAEPFKRLGLQAPLNDLGAHLLFPNLPLFSGASWFGTGLLTPLAPDATRMTLWLWAREGQGADHFVEQFRYITEQEDGQMAARLQSTVRSPAFQVGPLTEQHEAPIGHFHDHYLKFMSS